MQPDLILNLTTAENILVVLVYFGIGLGLMAVLGGIAALVEMMIGRRERR